MPEIQKVRYTHDAMIDEILIEPSISQGELGKRFGLSQTWVSIIVNSDAFKERMAERKGVLLDPKITASIENRLESLAKVSLDRLMERVDSSVPLKPMELVAIAKLSVGNRADKPVAAQTQNNLYVLSIPGPAATSKEWLSSTRRPPGDTDFVIENTGGLLPSPQTSQEAA